MNNRMKGKADNDVHVEKGDDDWWWINAIRLNIKQGGSSLLN